jgi:hypothetical protein
MIVMNGRAQLWILGDTYTIALKAPYNYETVTNSDSTTYVASRISIPIYASAWSDFAVSFAALSVLGASLFV